MVDDDIFYNILSSNWSTNIVDSQIGESLDVSMSSPEISCEYFTASMSIKNVEWNFGSSGTIKVEYGNGDSFEIGFDKVNKPNCRDLPDEFTFSILDNEAFFDCFKDFICPKMRWLRDKGWIRNKLTKRHNIIIVE